jgi:hypothetical protein
MNNIKSRAGGRLAVKYPKFLSIPEKATTMQMQQ